MASTIAACGRAERDGTRKHETLFNRPAPTHPRRGRSRHLPPPKCGDVRGLPLEGQTLSQAPQPDQPAGSLTHSWSHAHQGRRLSYRPACPVGSTPRLHPGAALQALSQFPWGTGQHSQYELRHRPLGLDPEKTDECRRAQRNRPYGPARPRSLPPGRAPDLSRAFVAPTSRSPRFMPEHPAGSGPLARCPATGGRTPRLSLGFRSQGCKRP